MLTLRRCIALIFVVFKKFNAATAEGPISELYKQFEEDVLLLSVDAEEKDETLATSLENLAENIGCINMKKGWEADGVSQWGTLPMGKTEAELTTEAVEHAKAALDRYDALSMQEPQRLVQIFRELVNRRNELDPPQTQDRPRS